ncbi:MAG: peroxiredoxin [Bacteroidetes bacterium]|nr:peroxiredoxin [Bacteroidota bacterium]
MANLLLGKPAPEFVAKALVKGEIIDNFSLKDFIGQYIVFFFYPLDFTFVCPTELHAFQERLAEFHQRNAQVVACSVDSWFSHSAWLNTPRNRGGIEGVEYPLVSDLNKTISKAYQVLKEEDGIAYRGLFLIDRQGIIRHLLVNDLSLGRSVEEALRLVDALNYVEKHGEVCPANWRTGSKAMKPTSEGLLQYFDKS